MFERSISYQKTSDKSAIGIGKAKAIASAGTTLFYLRLTDAQRILYHYRYEGIPTNRKVEIIYILSVSNKTNFQRKLLYSAQQKVHASAWDDFNWDSSVGSELNLEDCRGVDLQELEKQAMSQFDQLPESDKQRNFSRERFMRECERSTIYNHFEFHDWNKTVLILRTSYPKFSSCKKEQDNMLRANKKQFLLEGRSGCRQNNDFILSARKPLTDNF